MRLAVAGAGIAGLAGALRLRDLARERGIDLEIALFERDARLGGCIQTLHAGGVLLEMGADSLLAEKPAAARLLERLHLTHELVGIQPEYRGALILRDGRLQPISGGLNVLHGLALPSADESVADFVTRHLGQQTLDRIVQPLVGGIYSADTARLSSHASLAPFIARDPAAPPRLMALRNGMQSLIEALDAQLRDVPRIRRDVTSARALCEEGFDGVLCALPAAAAASALQDWDADLAELLRGLRANSIASVHLVYDRAALPELPRAQGFVVPFVEGRRITAATISTQKYPHRAPADRTALRAFIGGALQNELLAGNDADLIAIAREEFAGLLGVQAMPLSSVVQRWMNVLPEYAVGHLDCLAAIEARAARFPVALAGAAYRGVGIPDCIASGQAAAELLMGKMISD